MDFISMDYEVSSSASGRIEANMSTARFSSLSLKEQLQAAMVEEFLPSAPTSRPRRKFLPRDQIEALINRGAVQQELTRSAPHIPRVIRDIYAQAVCSARRRIFAILVLIDQTSLISGFMGNDLTDSILPISFCSNGVRSSLGLRENVIRCFTGFPHRVLDDFGSAQWALLVPIIGEYSNSVQALNLDHEYILPFIVDSTMEGGAMTIRGGFSTIYKVKIHKAHIGSQAKRYSYFAVKEISNSNDEAFTSELEALEKVSLLDHSHLVPVTASITRGQEKLFVFPWAETNLRQYWKGRSLSVQRSEVRCAKWTLQQLSGLASALDTLHNSALGSCRHGDLKPENILLFQDQSNLTSPGKLVISDFGFAKFSSQPDANENDIPGGYTVRYSPPEVRTALQRSRLYDVWSLGCLFLEFITWYLEGYEAVETLRTPLSLTNEDKTHEDDKFKSVFYETRHDSRHAGVNVSLKPGVLKSLARLRYNSRASPFLNLLDLIQYRMLEPSPTKRADALEVFSSVKVFTAEFDMPMNDGFCTLCHRAGEAEHDAWDVYGVKDPLQHNLIAGNMASECRTPNLSRLEDVHSDFVPQTTDHAEEFPEDEPSSPDLLPSMLPTNRELASPIHAQSWNDTIDSGYYSMPLESSEQTNSLDSSGFLSQRKRDLEHPSSRPSTSIKRLKQTTDPSSPRINIPGTLNPSSSSEGSEKSQLFPCPFHQHYPAKFGTKEWRSCMGPGWTISRLKEHIYRRHCRSKFICKKCSADCQTQLKLAEHQAKAVCPRLSEPASTKIDDLKKNRIHERLTNKSDAEKYTTIYQILFGCDPQIVRSSNAQSSQPLQPTENSEAVKDFEHFLRTKKCLGSNGSSNERAQTCLEMIQEWRDSQRTTHPAQVFRDTSAVPGSDNLHIENVSVQQLPEYGIGPFPDVGNESIVPKPPDFETANGDRSFLDELHNTCNVTDQWLSETFSSDPSGDFLGGFNTAAEGNHFIPGDWT